MKKLFNRCLKMELCSAHLQDQSGETALHKAVKHGQIEIVRLLLGKGGAKIGQKDNKGMTAIHFAVDEGHKDIVRLLLQKGADIKAQNLASQSALDLARSTNNQDAEIHVLLSNRPLIEGPSSKSFYGDTERDLPEVIPLEGIRPCKSFQATIAEFYNNGDKELRVLEQPSVYELIKSKGPDLVLEHARPEGLKATSICKWYHIPANNVCKNCSK